MNSNCIVDGGAVLANGNTNCMNSSSTELTATNLDGAIISNNLQNSSSNCTTTSVSAAGAAAAAVVNAAAQHLLMTNNGKFQSTNPAATANSFVTLPDINMDSVKPKASSNTSYQITSITVGTRSSADEDSADDLDESHTTDENSSRITDMENDMTPSFSEDSNIYSKDDVFATAYAHGIPIMHQNNMSSADLSNYSTMTAPPTTTTTMNNNSGNNQMCDGGVGGKKMPAADGTVRVNCVTANVEKSKGVEIKGSERFKVVKIESIEPFKRGRWTCMDYLDQSAKQVQMHLGGLAKTVATDSGIILNDTKPVKKQGKTVKTEILANQVQNAVPAAHLGGQSAPNTMKQVEVPSPAQTIQQQMPQMQQQGNVNVAKTPNAQPGQMMQSNQGVPQQQQQQQQPQQMQQQPQQMQQPQTQPNAGTYQQQPQQQQQQPTHNVQQAQSLPPQVRHLSFDNCSFNGQKSACDKVKEKFGRG